MKLAETGGYEYHPASLAYPLLEGDELNTLADDIKANGLLEPIVLLEGKVLDGRNRLRACVLRGVKPTFADYDGSTDEESLEAYVDSRNLHRRHLTVEQVAERAARRRSRVAAARAAGQSIRSIAQQEGVSKSQVERDLENAPGVPGGTPGAELPPNGQADPAEPSPTVTGTDGKTYPANRPPKPLCDRCKRVGAVKGCAMCREMRQATRPKKPPGEKKPPREEKPPPVDAFGNPIPKRCRSAYTDPWLQEAIDFLGVMAVKFWGERLADGMHKRKGRYPFFNTKDFIDGCGFAGNYLEDVLKHLKDNRPAGVCPCCKGEGCHECRLSGLVPRELYAKLKAKKEGVPS